jgi:predicted anti-sigma-YlaC factor YlaD
MTRDCEEIRKSLGAWLDRELGASDAADFERHLQSCASCAAEKSRLERIESSLKRMLESEASRVAFEPFWAGVRRRIAEHRSWRARAADWARAAFVPPRLAWAVPAMIILVLGILSLEQFFPGWRSGFGQTNLAAVESIDGHGFNVALLREAKTKTTVIWLFENQESENETAADPVSSEQAF